VTSPTLSRLTPSTAINPADTREIVVSEAFPSSIFPVVVTVATVILGVPVRAVAMVLSPVLAPDTVVVPVTARVGVEVPEITTEFTLEGVIAPRVREIAGVVVEVATEPETPFAVVTDTSVTVPVPPTVCQVASSLRNLLAGVPVAGTPPFFVELIAGSLSPSKVPASFDASVMCDIYV
jgi:hypothetical protein